MQNNNQLLIVHALSPLHAGIGQGVGAIDLPIAREVATGIPYLPGSSIKGVLRDAAEAKYKNKELINAIFGSADDTTANIGAITFSDARLLLMPVRSLTGVFAWVTSPYMLRLFMQDAGIKSEKIKLPVIKNNQECQTWSKKNSFTLDGKTVVVLEDLQLNVKEPESKSTSGNNNDENNKVEYTWPDIIGEYLPAEQSYLKEHICVVHDDVMSYLLESATDVRTRIKIDDEFKVSQGQALWYEENLPAESLLYSLIVVDKATRELKISEEEEPVPPEESLEKVSDVLATTVGSGIHQFGGKATVGRGLCSIKLYDRENGNA